MCVADARDIKYDGAIFSIGAITVNMDTPLPELYAALEAPRVNEHRGEMMKYENDLKNYVRTSRLFHGEKNTGDPKAMERTISYFCTSVMSLNAVSFLELTSMSLGELYLAIPPLERKDRLESSEAGKRPANGGTKDAASRGIEIPCDPVLDPAAGVPADALSAGDVVCCKIREDSEFFNRMFKKSAAFDGTVSGEITAINFSEPGSAVISLKLSDGVSGTLKLTGKAGIKTLSRKEPSGRAGTKSIFRPGVLLPISGVVVFLFAIWFLLRLWG
jgi:hypothetical protein